jgi:hypothetical protein
MPPPVRDAAVAVRGFEEIQRALLTIGEGAEPELRKRLRNIGEEVARAAPGFVTHKTGRHGGSGNPALESSVRVSVGLRSASVYSTALHGGVQNVGGGPHAGWAARGPHVQHKNASEWMNKAVRSKQAFVEAEILDLLAWVETEWSK